MNGEDKPNGAQPQKIGASTEVVGPAVAVAEEDDMDGLPAAPWERMKIVNGLRRGSNERDHLAKVRTIMVGARGPPLQEEVGFQPCFCCLCFLCCEPCWPLIAKAKGSTFIDERQDRPWKEILVDMFTCATALWLVVCLLIFAGWGYLAQLTNTGKMLTMWEGQIQTYWSMMYFDLVPNVLTAYVYHQYRFWHPLHKAEHKYIFQSKGIVTQFSVGAAYFVYFNTTTAPIYVLTILPAIITNRTETHWECAIFFATWVQTLIMFHIRILMWIMEQRPSMYSYAPTAFLNFLRFFKTHFTMAAFTYYEEGKYKGKTMSTGYGNLMPFFDVLIGSCPFDVRYSIPFPYIDFMTHSAKTWGVYVDPADIKWSPLQKVWYAFWSMWLAACTIISFGTYWLPFGSCFPWDSEHSALVDSLKKITGGNLFPGTGISVPSWAPLVIFCALLFSTVLLGILACRLRAYFLLNPVSHEVPVNPDTLRELQNYIPPEEQALTPKNEAREEVI